jgi:hypothetical protein
LGGFLISKKSAQIRPNPQKSVSKKINNEHWLMTKKKENVNAF